MAPATAMDRYRDIGGVFRYGSCRHSRPYRIGSHIPAGFNSWLAVYTDEVDIDADFISWAGEYLLSCSIRHFCLDLDRRVNSVLHLRLYSPIICFVLEKFIIWRQLIGKLTIFPI